MKRKIGFALIKRGPSPSAVLSLLVIFIVIVPESVMTQVEQDWVARYDGPRNGSDEAAALAVDVRGNVYVTGFSTGLTSAEDYATIKYDANGNELWVARYNGPRNGSDEAAALAVDAGGNVYVTGFSTGLTSAEDYATIKYDANGNELWVERYNGPGNGSDEATAIAVNAGGNVYVTGSSDGLGAATPSDYATIKLVPSQSNGGGGGDNRSGKGTTCFISAIAD